MHTLHIVIDTDTDEDALVVARGIHANAQLMFGAIVLPSRWDVSSVDHTGEQDWSVLIRRSPVTT